MCGPAPRKRRSTGLPAGTDGPGATRGSGAGVRKRARPRTRSRPSDCGVAPSPAPRVPCDPALRAAEPQHVAAPPDERVVRCASPEARSAHRPPTSFAQAGTAINGSAGAPANAPWSNIRPTGGIRPLGRGSRCPALRPRRHRRGKPRGAEGGGASPASRDVQRSVGWLPATTGTGASPADAFEASAYIAPEPWSRAASSGGRICLPPKTHRDTPQGVKLGAEEPCPHVATAPPPSWSRIPVQRRHSRASGIPRLNSASRPRSNANAPTPAAAPWNSTGGA